MSSACRREVLYVASRLIRSPAAFRGVPAPRNRGVRVVGKRFESSDHAVEAVARVPPVSYTHLDVYKRQVPTLSRLRLGVHRVTGGALATVD